MNTSACKRCVLRPAYDSLFEWKLVYSPTCPLVCKGASEPSSQAVARLAQASLRWEIRGMGDAAFHELREPAAKDGEAADRVLSPPSAQHRGARQHLLRH